MPSRSFGAKACLSRRKPHYSLVQLPSARFSRSIMNFSVIVQALLVGLGSAASQEVNVKGCDLQGASPPRGDTGVCPAAGQSCEAFCADLYNQVVLNVTSEESVNSTDQEQKAESSADQQPPCKSDSNIVFPSDSEKQKKETMDMDSLVGNGNQLQGLLVKMKMDHPYAFVLTFAALYILSRDSPA
ncbi:hypothetical protein L249_0874 [Ophiocordyceps polyrhachis-furcata BCC 54312]|uniref:Uncharacterized protein n=1 Tax=Ophiocordyceps polyrhachis-furcata BCC 54312 TaxID=1330021 RepID=A0A367LE22_9HYPO|nr:hypothetical protein L249_0874 [Ophiocordyceps polyrhachis-furcata BCC 54312]